MRIFSSFFIRTVLKKPWFIIIFFYNYKNILNKSSKTMKPHYYKEDILEICKNKHLTVEEIFSELSKLYPEAWKSSVYRNVEEMVKDWELKKVVWVGKKAYFENTKHKHIHLIDKNTWEIFDLDENLKILNLPKNFIVSDMDIKIFWEFKK